MAHIKKIARNHHTSEIKMIATLLSAWLSFYNVWLVPMQPTIIRITLCAAPEDIPEPGPAHPLIARGCKIYSE